MKRYWLFGGDDYYAGGGMADFRGWFDTVESAREVALSAEFENDWSAASKCEWWEVLDTQSMEVVDSNLEKHADAISDWVRKILSAAS